MLASSGSPGYPARMDLLGKGALPYADLVAPPPADWDCPRARRLDSLPNMTIPDYQSIMLPLLEYTADGREHRATETTEHLADRFKLTDEERRELLPSGRSLVIRNRTGWARTYLRKAGLLVSPKRGVFLITDRGRGVLAQNPERIDNKFLDQFPEFVEFRTKKSDQPGPVSTTATEESKGTPEERLDSAYSDLRVELKHELLQQVQSASPQFFEQLVVDVLVSMGYGGSRKDAGQALGGSGDGGIDGIIKEDRLGLSVIYLQAKRWENTVGRPEIQKFAGALQGHRATKGVFLTTSNYSREALEYARTITSKIVLLDGDRIGDLMLDCGVGVSTVQTIKVQRIDHDYFSEE